MKVYTINNLFLFGGLTKANHPYLVIGKHLHSAPAFFEQLKNMLDSFTVPALCSAQTLDNLLAAVLRKVKPWPFLIGCTINVPGIPGPTGGVLGNPRLKAVSAQGELEELGDGWKLLSFPGGPGLAYKERIRDSFYPEVKSRGKMGKETLLNLAAQAYSRGAEELLALTDGTGSGAAGSAMIQYKRDYCIWTLDDILSHQTPE